MSSIYKRKRNGKNDGYVMYSIYAYDPLKNKKWNSVSLLSWKKNRRIRLVDFIPALSVYAGVNYIPKNSI